MTTREKIARRKLGLLQLASELSNVSKACRIMCYSRQQFYEIRRNYQSFDSERLLGPVAWGKGPHPNRVEESMEAAILEHSLRFPIRGPLRVARVLALAGVQVSSGGGSGASGAAMTI